MAHSLLTWETGHHRIRQLQLELAIQRVDQLILRFEVGKQRAFCNPGSTRNGCRRSTQPALRENLDRRCKDRVAFVFALRLRHLLRPLLMSIYSTIDETQANLIPGTKTPRGLPPGSAPSGVPLALAPKRWRQRGYAMPGCGRLGLYTFGVGEREVVA